MESCPVRGRGRWEASPSRPSSALCVQRSVGRETPGEEVARRSSRCPAREAWHPQPPVCTPAPPPRRSPKEREVQRRRARWVAAMQLCACRGQGRAGDNHVPGPARPPGHRVVRSTLGSWTDPPDALCEVTRSDPAFLTLSFCLVTRSGDFCKPWGMCLPSAEADVASGARSPPRRLPGGITMNCEPPAPGEPRSDATGTASAL